MAGTAYVVRSAAATARLLLSRGTARELAMSGVHLALYPFGYVTAARRELGLRPRNLAEQGLMAIDPATAFTPVVLVHGYVHNRSAFMVMSRALKRAGFQHVRGFNYNPLTRDLDAVAALLAAEIDRVLEAAGAERCILVGHSMGGMVARAYVQDLGGDRTVDTLVTIGTPHGGTLSSYLGLGPAAVQLRPESPWVRRLRDTARPSAVRHLNYWSATDLLIAPAANGVLDHPALNATNVEVRNTGHTSMLLDYVVVGDIIDHLVHPDLDRTARETLEGSGAVI